MKIFVWIFWNLQSLIFQQFSCSVRYIFHAILYKFLVICKIYLNIFINCWDFLIVSNRLFCKSVSLSLTAYHVKYKVKSLNSVKSVPWNLSAICMCPHIRGNNIQMCSVCVIVENSVHQIEVPPIPFYPLWIFYVLLCIYICL